MNSVSDLGEEVCSDVTGNCESGRKVVPVSLFHQFHRCHSPEFADVIVAWDKNEGISQPGLGNETEALLRDLGISPLMHLHVSHKSPLLQKR